MHLRAQSNRAGFSHFRSRAAKRGLTLRSSGAPRVGCKAWSVENAARHRPGLAAHSWRPLSSNVRRLGGEALGEGWRQHCVEGLGPISRVAAVFQVGPPLAALPFASLKVKVVERADCSFLGVPNVAVMASDGSPDWVSGMGSTVEEALADALRYFVSSLGGRSGLGEESFAWAAPEDF